jgi:malate dehydrogenase (oxaloacetate-decarboxylating)
MSYAPLPPVKVTLKGVRVLEEPLLNKDAAFTMDERTDLGLHGLLPPHIDSLDQQIKRCYEAYLKKNTDLEKHIYLRALQDRNETLFYAFMQEHIEEMMPIIYTPVVGLACQQFSHIYRHNRGLFISFPLKKSIESIFSALEDREKVRIIVVTDGERILGLGDQGAGGLGIPIGKLSLYTLCGGIDPAQTLPIILDVGTNNQQNLEDPLYIGYRNERIIGPEYDQFIEAFVEAVIKFFPKAVLQFEDFANQNARRLLEQYRDKLCTFNDDIQGTAAVALSAVLSGVLASGKKLADQKIVMFGAGSAGMGIAELIYKAMIEEGLTEAEAKDRFWLVDRPGLLHSGIENIQPIQKLFRRDLEKLQKEWQTKADHFSLAEVAKYIKPTVLIGTSAQPNSFTEEVIRAMTGGPQRPIILPLSNPTSKTEAQPEELINWTDGKALVATGSPFPPVKYKDRTIKIGQCNNSYIFPGVGLGIVASGATRVPDACFTAAAKALALTSPINISPNEPLFPRLSEINIVSRKIAIAVAVAAQAAGVAPALSLEETTERVDKTMWMPVYRSYTV